MRGLALFLTAVEMTLSAFAAEPVTVEQLRAVLARERESGESALVARLSVLQLTEQLNSQELTRLKANLPGEKSRAALVSLADASVFLDPPRAEIESRAAPDLAEQRQIAARVVDYVARASHKLPNFFATRTTMHFEDWPLGYQKKGMVAGRYIPPQLTRTTRSGITYRNGAEVLEASKSKKAKPEAMNSGLDVTGLFGPVMATVLMDSSRGKMKWSRWETGDHGTLAVFAFAVPLKGSSYKVKFCCVPGPASRRLFSRITAYHGEIAANPEDGTIARLTLIADLAEEDMESLAGDLEAGSPISRADIFVEYGPVEIGGKLYTCPVRSVALSVAKAEIWVTDQSGRHEDLGPERLYINDMVFEDYHVFRSEARILPYGVEP